MQNLFSITFIFKIFVKKSLKILPKTAMHARQYVHQLLNNLEQHHVSSSLKYFFEKLCYTTYKYKK